MPARPQVQMWCSITLKAQQSLQNTINRRRIEIFIWFLDEGKYMPAQKDDRANFRHLPELMDAAGNVDEPIEYFCNHYKPPFVAYHLLQAVAPKLILHKVHPSSSVSADRLDKS